MNITKNYKKNKNIFLGHNNCLNSSYDFNIITKALAKNGFKLVNDIKDADIYIYSGCGVRDVWVDSAINEINKNIKRNNKLNVIATGCFSSIDPQKLASNINSNNLKLFSFSEIMTNFTNSSIEDMDTSLSQNEMLNYEGNNKQRQRVNKTKLTLLEELKKIDTKYNTKFSDKYKETTKGFVFYNENQPTEYITITRGCPYNCSYCAIPLGRGGKYTSIPLGNIINKIDYAVNNGIQNILFIGDEIGNYGMGTNELNLSRLLDIIFEHYDITIGIRYLEPKPFLKHYETIKKYCLLEKIKLLYIPLQSGSNRILQLMTRSYNITDELINKLGFLRTNTNVILYTNWMVGFNDESYEDFGKTKQLMKILNFHINMVIPFSERPNTHALTIKNKISKEEKKLRHTELYTIVKNMKKSFFSKEIEQLTPNEQSLILNLLVEAENYEVLID